MKRRYRAVRESKVTQTYLVRPEYLGGNGRLLTVQMVHWVCEAANTVAVHYSESEVTIRTIDNQDFYAEVELNDLIIVQGSMLHVGQTMMEIVVDILVENKQGEQREVNRSYVVMEAVDAQMCPKTIPGILAASI